MYLELLKQILSIVNRENDLNGNNIVEKIKEELKKRDLPAYQEWEKKDFNINYEFSNNNDYNKKELTLLHAAFIDNQENVVKALLAVDGINVNFQYLSDKTLLHLAIEKGDENIVKALLAVDGINVNFRDERGRRTPLHLASEKGNEKIVNALLAVDGINVNFRDERGRRTPLHLASEKGNEKIVEALLDKRARVDLQDEYGKAPLHLAIEKGNEKIVNALLAVDGINVNLRDNDKKTPLYLAVQKGKMEIVEAILDNKPDIDLPNHIGYTPLCAAVEESHHKVVRALLEKGADPLVKGRCNKNLAEMATEDAIMRGIVCGVGIFVIASVVAAIIVTSAYFIGVSLSVGAMAGIAVAAAVVTGLVAGGIIYEVYKPCDELKEAIAKKMSELSQNSAVDDSKSDCSLKNPKTYLLAPIKGFINELKSFFP